LRLVTAPEEHVAGQEVDDQVAWVWVIYLRLIPGIEEQVAVEELDDIAG
jgi:hypothetical protein